MTTKAMEFCNIIADLPSKYVYTHVVEKSTIGKICVKVDGVTNEEEAIEWLAGYSETTKTTWRARRKATPAARIVVYRTQRRCQHNTLPRSKTADNRKGSKNTNCPAWLKLTVRNTYRHETAHMMVELHSVHNHGTLTPAALSKRDVSAETRRRLLELFAEGYGAAGARAALRSDIMLRCSATEYSKLLYDRAVLPDLGYIDKLYSTNAVQCCETSDGSPLESVEATETTAALMELQVEDILSSNVEDIGEVVEVIAEGLHVIVEEGIGEAEAVIGEDVQVIGEEVQVNGKEGQIIGEEVQGIGEEVRVIMEEVPVNGEEEEDIVEAEELVEEAEEDTTFTELMHAVATDIIAKMEEVGASSAVEDAVNVFRANLAKVKTPSAFVSFLTSAGKKFPPGRNMSVQLVRLGCRGRGRGRRAAPTGPPARGKRAAGRGFPGTQLADRKRSPPPQSLIDIVEQDVIVETMIEVPFP